ncbi:MAG: hypothetical protein SGI98_02835 [Verrucomicrobiota bacterium]|nr:hypothetical protein [Verrucomicrobiota bacterium]
MQYNFDSKGDGGLQRFEKHDVLNKEAEAKRLEEERQRQLNDRLDITSKIHLGKQSYGNCNIESCRTLLFLAARYDKLVSVKLNSLFGTDQPTEKQLLDYAINQRCAAEGENDLITGGMNQSEAQKLLQDFGIKSKSLSSNIDNIAKDVDEGKGGIVIVDNSGGKRHAIVVAAIERDIKGVIINVALRDFEWVKLRGKCDQRAVSIR